MKKRIFSVLCGALVAITAGVSNADMLLHYGFDQVDGAGPFTTPDSSALSNTGSLVNMDNNNLVPGKIGNALRFDGGNSSGTADRVEIAENDPDFDQTFTEFTFAAWVKPTSAAFVAGANAWIAGKMTTGSNRGWQINLNPADDPLHPGELVFSYFPTNANANSQDVYLGPNANIAADKWVHLAATFKGGDMVKLYVNGELAVATAATNATLNGSNNRPLQVGNRGSNIANSWNGLIDEVYIFNEALSARQIAALVPEPTSLVVAFVGLAMMMGILEQRRRKRKES
jgi:hypothetical protein